MRCCPGSEAVPQFVTGGPAGSVAGSEDDPQLSRSRLSEFLHRHTAYELIPESGKVGRAGHWRGWKGGVEYGY